MIQLVTALEDPELFRYLARKYIAELQKFDKRTVWNNAYWEKAIDNARFIEIDGETVGFAVYEPLNIGNKKPALFIHDFLVLPKWRRKKIGSRAVREITRNWKNDICLFVLDKNMPAKTFWSSMEKYLNWVRKSRKDIEEVSGSALRVYTVRANPARGDNG